MMCMKPVKLDDIQLQKALNGEVLQIRQSIKNVPQGQNIIGRQVNIGNHQGKEQYQFINADDGHSAVGEPFTCPLIDCGKSDDSEMSANHEYQLWVEEEWRIDGWCPDQALISVEYKYYPDGKDENFAVPFSLAEFNRLASESEQDCIDNGAKKSDYGWVWQPGYSPCRWRSAVDMPKWASRLSLDVIDIGIEVTDTDQGVVAEWVCHAKGVVEYKSGEFAYD